MQNNKVRILSIIIGLFGIIVFAILCALFFKVENKDAWMLVLALLFQLAALIIGFCYTCFYMNAQEDEKSQIISKFNEMSQKISDIGSITSNNLEMYFLQSLAASIGDKGSLWTNEQIDRFLQCMESICKKTENKS